MLKPVGFRIDQNNYGKLKEQAEKYGLTISAYAKQLVNSYIKNGFDLIEVGE